MLWRHLACNVPIVDPNSRRRPAVPVVPGPGWLPGAGWRAVTADHLPAGALHLAGPVRVDGELPAHLVEHHVVVPPAVELEPGHAGVPAVGAVHHVVRLTPGCRLVAAAGELARLIP